MLSTVRAEARRTGEGRIIGVGINARAAKRISRDSVVLADSGTSEPVRCMEPRMPAKLIPCLLTIANKPNLAVGVNLAESC